MIGFQHTSAQQTDYEFNTTVTKTYLAKLTDHQKSLQKQNQGFMNLHSQHIDEIESLNGSILPSIDHICVLGIGGSMLGPKFIIDALQMKNSTKQFVFLDNIDPDEISKVSRELPLERTLFLVQSKSGTTPETIAQFSFFLNKCLNQGLEIHEHFIFVTDPDSGYLREFGNKRGITMFHIPKNVGGRFSVLTPVGLVSASLAGIDIRQLLLGSESIIDRQLMSHGDVSAYLYACQLHYYYTKQLPIHVIMPYSDRLKLFGDWATQLISESTGKNRTRDGEDIEFGITPLPARGATDQHSQLQLFVEGPKDKTVTIIRSNETANISIDPDDSLPDEFKFLSDHTFGELLNAELEGTRTSLIESNVPVSVISLNRINEYSIGQLIQFYQLAIGYLGEITSIDMFNQPGVERSKVLAKEMLSK